MFVLAKRGRAITRVSFSLSSLNSNVFWSFTKRYVERKVKFGGKFFWSIIIVTLVTQCLPSYFLSRPIA